jgi:hypothetical protein
MERVVTFGRRSELVGILATPADEAKAQQRPAVLMWNVGVNHRVGPYRIYVELCRRLADAGYAAFRFDASGLGDSEVRREAVTDSERENLDVSDAMDAITRRTGIRSFVLIGFCSSVDAAHRVSVKDKRVVGVVHIEGYAFCTSGFRRRRALRLLSLRRWERLAWRNLPQFFPHVEPATTIVQEAVYKRDYPEWSAFSHDLEQLTQRGAELLFVYVGGDMIFNHEDQFWEMFGTPGIDRRKVSVAFYPDADHTFFGVEARRSVSTRIVEWLRTVAPAKVAVAAATAHAEAAH